jgi:hypothetical protein
MVALARAASPHLTDTSPAFSVALATSQLGRQGNDPLVRSQAQGREGSGVYEASWPQAH